MSRTFKFQPVGNKMPKHRNSIPYKRVKLNYYDEEED